MAPTCNTKAPNPKLLKRNQRIRARYLYLTEEKHLNSDYVLGLLEDEFLPLKKGTIWLIVSRTGFYKKL